MKVYLACVGHDDNNPIYPYGVFSTVEKATEAVKNFKQSFVFSVKLNEPVPFTIFGSKFTATNRNLGV